MADVDTAYSALAAERGLQQPGSVVAGPLTPLLVESGHCQIEPAVSGRLSGNMEGVAGRLSYKRNKTFRFNVALAQVPGSTEFVPRLFCVRRGRSTRDDEFYGFEARHSKLWTESTKLNERYTISTSPFQDPNWLRQLFSPALVDWLASDAARRLLLRARLRGAARQRRGGRPRPGGPRRPLRRDRARRRADQARV